MTGKTIALNISYTYGWKWPNVVRFMRLLTNTM